MGRRSEWGGGQRRLLEAGLKMHIIDRRLNPKSKSLGNRQRFIRRAKADIREAVQDALKKRKVSDVEGAEERVLSGFDFDRYRFRCMTIERPSVALREVMAHFGYRLVKELPGLDAFFIHEDFLAEYTNNALHFWAKRY